MIKILYNLRQLPLFRREELLANNLYRREFRADVQYINFNRLRVWGYFMIIFVLWSLYADFFLSEFLLTGQVSMYFYLDVFLFFITIIVLYTTHLKKPKSNKEISTWRNIVINWYILFHLLWTTAISIIEAPTTNSVPTYLLGMFSAATIFYIRGGIFSIYLLISFLALFAGLYLNNLTIDEIVNQYISVVALVMMAWVTGRVLYTTRIKSFTVNKLLEISHNNLDQKVKDQTVILRTTNEKLIEEINERKRYEKNLEHETKKAQEADRLKSVFLANMSHEIRTPLNGILGFGDLLQNPNLTDDKKGRYLEIINSNSQQLLKIVDDIMDISMIESNQLKTNKINFNISHLFPDALEFFKNLKRILNKEHIEIIVDGFAKSMSDRIYSDPTRIQQILYNILSNALKFTEKGFIKFSGHIEHGFALIYVEDTGIGIQPEISKTIFKPFRQGEETITRSYGGTGLGLSISKGLIELLDGMIWADMSYKQGARICFSLPAGDSRRPSKYQKNFSQLNTIDFLMINQNAQDFSFISESLKVYKARINWVNYENLVTKFTGIKPNLIILNTDDNNSNLMQMASKTCEIFPKIPIIAILPEAYKHNDDLINAGCSVAISKPVNIQLLLNQCLLLNEPSASF